MDEEKNEHKNGAEQGGDLAESAAAAAEDMRHVTPPGDFEMPYDEHETAAGSELSELAIEGAVDSGAATVQAPNFAESDKKLAVSEESSSETAGSRSEVSPAVAAAFEETAQAFESVDEAAAPRDAFEPLEETIRPKWNWGAFSLTFFFGIAHRAYLGLLILLSVIPWIGWIFGLVWMIVFGFYGEKWALENPDNHYRDQEEFRKVMDGWNRAGLIAFIVGLIVFVLLLVIGVILLSFFFSHMNDFQNQIQQQTYPY